MRNKNQSIIAMLTVGVFALTLSLNIAIAEEGTTTSNTATKTEQQRKLEELKKEEQRRLEALKKAQMLVCPDGQTAVESSSNSGTGAVKGETTTNTTKTKTCVPKNTLKSSFEQSEGKRLETIRVKERQEKIRGIGQIYQNQIDRAQKSIDQLSKIITRIKAQRAKMTTASAADLAAIDTLIIKADTQKQEAETALAALKTKATSLQATLGAIQTDTTNEMDSATTTVNTMKQQVREFQTSVEQLKRKIIALHETLKQIVRKMKVASKVETNSNSGSDAGEGEDN